MAASDKVLSSILKNPPPSISPITYQWLLPNSKGFENFFKTMNAAASAPNEYLTPPPSPNLEGSPALNTSSQDPNAMSSSISGVNSKSQASEAKHEISIFLAATESFSKKNTNCSVQESLDRFAPLMAESRAAGYPVRAYISVALGCPFEGPDVNPHRVAELAASLLEMGADEISVADTTGMGTAPRTRMLLQTLKEAGIQNSDLVSMQCQMMYRRLANRWQLLGFPFPRHIRTSIGQHNGFARPWHSNVRQRSRRARRLPILSWCNRQHLDRGSCSLFAQPWGRYRR